MESSLLYEYYEESYAWIDWSAMTSPEIHGEQPFFNEHKLDSLEIIFKKLKKAYWSC